MNLKVPVVDTSVPAAGISGFRKPSENSAFEPEGFLSIRETNSA